MDLYLSDDSIERVFDILFEQLNETDLSISAIYFNVLRNRIKMYSDGIYSDYYEIEFDELGLIDPEKNLKNLKNFYCNSFVEENHIELLVFISDIIHDLNDKILFEKFYNLIDKEINSLNLCISCSDDCIFIGEKIDTLEESTISLNVLKMYKSFSEINRIEMVQERIKDAIFLLKSNRYTACLALVSFALEGFLRGIFSDSYDENEENYKVINAHLGKGLNDLSIILNYTNKNKPSIDLSKFPFDPNNRIDLSIRKTKEGNNNSIVEINLKNEFAGLICISDKEIVKKNKKYTLEKLIERALTDKLIDNKLFQYESFDFLRKVRNNIVHFDNEHKEVTQSLRTKKILLKIIDFINTRLYT